MAQNDSTRVDEVEVNLLQGVEGLEENHILKSLDFGAYGVVFKVSVNGLPCMAKKLHPHLVSHTVSSEDRDVIHKKFRQECILLSKLNHPNLVHFIGVCYSKGELIIVMERLRTDLAKFVEKHPGIPESIKILFLLDVSYGLHYLHSQNPPIIHRDLTAPNILLSDCCRAKIADLGVSKILHDNAVFTNVPGNLYYMAPETKFENARYGPSIDLFSFGHLTIHTAIQTWPQVYEVENVQSIDRGKIEVTKRKQALEAMGKNSSLYPLAIGCLYDSANGRPSCIEVNRQLIELSQKYPCSIDEIHFTAECLVRISYLFITQYYMF